MLIAIDGPAASGKGTIAKMIARHYGLEYLDTGKVYRLVGREMIARTDGNINLLSKDQLVKIADNIDLMHIDDKELDSEEIGKATSVAAQIPEVRKSLINFQREVAQAPNGAVLDGRDIGTVVCPEADFKFFFIADAAVRAKRRFKQLSAAQPDITEEEIYNDIVSRDTRDSKRSTAPMAAATDAVTIDTTAMTPQEAFDKCRAIIDAGQK